MLLHASPAASDDTSQTVKIYAGKLFDSINLQLLENRVISVSPDSGLVLDVSSFSREDRIAWDDPQVVDLRHATVLPGLVDVHVHFFLHTYSETRWDDQVSKESVVERTIRATIHSKRTLMAGYTAVRDLGTEGAGDADIHLRKCMAGPNPIIPGPRYFTANRAIVATGFYGPKSTIHLNQEGIEGITGAEVVDGEVECMKAVRRQIGAGADWIKVYAEYRPRTRIRDVSYILPSISIATFNEKELDALITTANRLGVKVAAHSSHWRTRLADKPNLPSGPGFHSIEHGGDITFDDETIAALRENSTDRLSTFWVPTLSIFYTEGNNGQSEVWKMAARNFAKALQYGIDNIACGGDTGPFPHGDNSLEMKLMVRLGAEWRKVLGWCTYGGWKCIRSMRWEGKEGAARLTRVGSLQEDQRLVGDNEVPFGVIRRGFAADIIATTGDLATSFERAVDKSSITFVMKGGKIYKRDGKGLV
ncbi:uncharacterized protein C8Q71DRAFT_732425 [Rhodofomes roseus]|uniref:Amidohydrolase-related domain-containing protein n=1 Tax=Rhodofomes roseus TaxID=34475 RepID=A0ABQ8KU16_9APHY|nr:uncharacterized protein C8Q71DRAFT_732425 [Rhodofomes roseus]KAH9842337.1 hypothetical protein C8Q71DRAFT_732425 [Rhodofomes roseus]